MKESKQQSALARDRSTKGRPHLLSSATATLRVTWLQNPSHMLLSFPRNHSPPSIPTSHVNRQIIIPSRVSTDRFPRRAARDQVFLWAEITNTPLSSIFSTNNPSNDVSAVCRAPDRWSTDTASGNACRCLLRGGRRAATLRLGTWVRSWNRIKRNSSFMR